LSPIPCHFWYIRDGPSAPATSFDAKGLSPEQ
jgi:hypothetical protein